ncbi:EAGR box-containing protein [[Mycoplasma] imitans]|uniref:EAGR box-containing protein n=1 Tax=[Mycoplasma] imitans TaxID=29560 RepID=UPI001FE0127A|nr:EAGR box-containing protein [[Mycoplasma] imitans]
MAKKKKNKLDTDSNKKKSKLNKDLKKIAETKINEEESESIFGDLYDGAEEVLPAALAYENGQLPEDGSIQVAFDGDGIAYYISYDAENQIFIEPYENYELDASALYDADGNPFDFFENYHVEGAEEVEAAEEEGEYWEQFIGVEGYGYYDENEEWVWTGYFDDNNEFIPNEEEVSDAEVVEEEVAEHEPQEEVQAEEDEEEHEEEVVEQEQPEEVVEEPAEEIAVQEQPEEVVEEPAVEEQAEQIHAVDQAQQPEEVVEEQPVQEQAEEVHPEQEATGEYWEQFIGIEGYGYYDENNEWIWTGYFDEENNFIPNEYYDEQTEAVADEQVAQEEYAQQPAEGSSEYWEQFIGVEGYGYYDENSEWVWTGYFDENNNFIPDQYYDEYAEPAGDEQVAQEEYAQAEVAPEQHEEQVQEYAQEHAEVVEEQPDEQVVSDEYQQEQLAEEAVGEDYAEEVQVEQQSDEVSVEEYSQTDDVVDEEYSEEVRDQDDQYNAIVPVEEQEPVQAGEVASGDEIDWTRYVGDENYGYYDENGEWVWTGYFNEYGIFIPQEEEYTQSLDVKQPGDETADVSEQTEESVDVLDESEQVVDETSSDEIVHVEDEQPSEETMVEQVADEVAPAALATVNDDLVMMHSDASEQEFGFDFQQFIGNIDFGYYDESSEWIWTGSFDNEGNFYDFDGNLIYTPYQTEKPVEAQQAQAEIHTEVEQPVEVQNVEPAFVASTLEEPKPTHLADEASQTALVVTEPDVFSEDIIQQVDVSQLDDDEEVVVRGLLNPATIPAQPEELKIQPVFEQEKLDLPVVDQVVEIQPETQQDKIDYSKHSDSTDLVVQSPVVLEDQVADDVISVDTKGFVPEAVSAFAIKSVQHDEIKLIQPKFDQITHLGDEIKTDVNVSSSDVDVQAIEIKPSQELSSEPSKLDIFIKKPVEIKNLEFVQPVEQKLDIKVVDERQVVSQPSLSINKPTYTDESESVAINSLVETTCENDAIIQVAPVVNEVSDFDINDILNTKAVETVTVELPKDEVNLVTGLHVTVVGVESKPVEEVVQFETITPDPVHEVVVEKEDKIALVEEEPFFNKFIGNDEYGYYNDKQVWIWTGYFDDENNFVSDKQTKAEKVDQLIEEFSKQDEIKKVEEVKVEKASEPFFNKFIGNSKFGYYNDKNVWIWNGYFDENDQFVPDQSSTKKFDKFIEDELQKQRIYELELQLAQAQEKILQSNKLKDQESAKLKDEEIAKVKEEIIKAQQESAKLREQEAAKAKEEIVKIQQEVARLKEQEAIRAKEAAKTKEALALKNFVSKASPLLNPAREAENLMTVYQNDKLEINDLRNEFSKIKVQKEEFDNFSKIHDLDVINLYNASTTRRGTDYIFSAFEKKEEQFIKKSLHFLEEVKADRVELSKEETISNIDQLLKQDPHLLLTQKQDKSVSPESSLAVLSAKDEIKFVEKPVDVIKPIEQVVINKQRSLLDDLVPKIDTKIPSINDDLIKSESIDLIEPIQKVQLKQERSLLDDYIPKFDDKQELNKVEFKFPTVNKEFRPTKVESINFEPIDVIKPIEQVQINKERSLLDDYTPKFDDLDSNFDKSLGQGELYEELKAEFRTDSKDVIDQLLEETNDLISSTEQTFPKIHSINKSQAKSVQEPILETKFDDKFIELDENQGFDELIVENDDTITNVIEEVVEEPKAVEPVVQPEVSPNQIAVTNEEYKKDMAELKQFLEKHSEQLFKQYFSKFEELSKLQMESFNQIKNELRSEMNDIRDEVRSSQLAVTSEITEEIFPSTPKVSRKQRVPNASSEPTAEFDFDNSLSLVSENNYDLYELLDRIINYEDVLLTSNNVFKSEEYQAKVKQSVHNIKVILKNSEKEATKNYNYILSTLKNEISLLQKDLPIINSQINKLQGELRNKQLSRADQKFVHEQIQELHTEHSNKTRAISFYNKKINDLKSIYAQQIRKIRTDYKKINDLANKRRVSSDYIDQAIQSFESTRNAQPNIKRNYEQLYRIQLNQNAGANYDNFRRYDPLIENQGYEYFSNHQPKEFFSELESIDNDIFSSNDLIYSNRNTYLDENFRINDYELTSHFDDIDSIYGMDKLRLPPLESSSSLNDLDFNNTFDIDFDSDF